MKKRSTKVRVKAAHLKDNREIALFLKPYDGGLWLSPNDQKKLGDPDEWKLVNSSGYHLRVHSVMPSGIAG
jgi:hypothetical protein